jgi:hypothetical protein
MPVHARDGIAAARFEAWNQVLKGSVLVLVGNKVRPPCDC